MKNFKVYICGFTTGYDDKAQLFTIPMNSLQLYNFQLMQLVIRAWSTRGI